MACQDQGNRQPWAETVEPWARLWSGEDGPEDDQGAHWPLPYLPSLCLKAERSRIPAHLKQVLFQGNQGAGPERSCSQPPSTGTGPGFRTQVEEEPARSSWASTQEQRSRLVSHLGSFPAQLSPVEEDEQVGQERMGCRLRPAHTEITFFKDRRQKITFPPLIPDFPEASVPGSQEAS